MTKVYIEQQGIPDLLMSLVFWPNFRFEISPKRLLLREIMAQYKTPFFEVVSDISAADFVAVPFEYFDALTHAPEYLERVYARAQAARKKVLLFDYSDYVDRKIRIPEHAILFRVSVYRHHKKQNELVMPYFVEDFGARYDFAPKEKGESCVVGYCGQSQFGNAVKRFRAQVKQFLRSCALRLSFDAEPAVHARGIFWRRRALDALARDGIHTAFIERSFYSLHRFGVPSGPQDIRREYAENLRTCDLALCVRGDSNASQRFYETFSACRIPLFLDTDCVLPLEEIIRYDEVLLRIPSREIETLAARVSMWWSEQTSDMFLAKETKARGIYEKYLRIDRYFEVVFDRERSPYRRILFSGE